MHQIHNDWEAHGDVGVDSYKFYDFWGAVAKELHPLGKEVGTCIEVPTHSPLVLQGSLYSTLSSTVDHRHRGTYPLTPSSTGIPVQYLYTEQCSVDCSLALIP
jgi:hypothetical protein